MLENLRYRIALYFIKKASVQIERGEIQKGMNNFKRSIWIVPPSKELSEFGDRLRQTLGRSPDTGSFFYAYLTIPLMEKSIFRFERKVGMKESKVKVWFEENKDKICAEVRCISWYAFGFGLAWFVNGKLTENECEWESPKRRLLFFLLSYPLRRPQ